MKKLVIAVASAAMIGGVFGAEKSSYAQVYDFAMTLKTGVCKDAKVSSATVSFLRTVYGTDDLEKNEANFAYYDVWTKGDEVAFRKQATQKIAGVFWGCECPTIANPAWRRFSNGRNLGGYVFWNQTSGSPFVIPNTWFSWSLLNRITDSFKTVEGVWNLYNNVDPQACAYTGAGFGTASVAKDACRAVVNKISGSFAGYRMPGSDDLVGGCEYCAIGGCAVIPFCAPCSPMGVNAAELTAAYGTWSIKFNASASAKLAKSARITSVYKFNKAGAFANGVTLVDALKRMEDYVANTARGLSTFSDLDDFVQDDERDDDYSVHAQDMDPEDIVKAFNYAVVKGAKVVDDDVVNASGDVLDEEAYMAALDLTLIEEDAEEEDAEDDAE